MNFRQRLLSQNLIRSPEVAAQLVGLSGIGPTDTVVDIGAGTGTITAELVKCAAQVIAVEIDPGLAARLKRRFYKEKKVTIHQADIRQFQLPTTAYKVVANIPFHITTEIIYKLLYYSCPPSEAYLVVPKEAAEKFTGTPHETQFSVLSKPWFDFQVVEKLNPTDFYPEPQVEVVFIKISKRQTNVISTEEENIYRSFVKFAFNTWKKDLKIGLKRIFTYKQWVRLARDNGFSIHAKPTDLTFIQWLAIFRFFRQWGEKLSTLP